jgi:hypothetical protein
LITSILNLGEGASVSGIQSIAINYGSAVLNVEQLADQVEAMVGKLLVESNEEIKKALEDLRQANEANKVSTIGAAIEALGRYMAHAGSAASVIGGIQLLVQFLR